MGLELLSSYRFRLAALGATGVRNTKYMSRGSYNNLQAIIIFSIFSSIFNNKISRYTFNIK